MTVILAALLAASGGALDLHLACRGGGISDFGSRATATTRDLSSGESVQTVVQGDNPLPFDDDVRIDLAGDGGRIRVPQTLLPPIRGGKNGWFDLRKVVATDDEITGVATINLFNKVKLRIDRHSGIASFTTLNGTFRGTCLPFDPRTDPRAF